MVAGLDDEWLGELGLPPNDEQITTDGEDQVGLVGRAADCADRPVVYYLNSNNI